MNDVVWVSDLMADPELILMVTNDVSQSDNDRMVEAEKLQKKGESVSASLCPKRIWGDQDSDAPKLRKVPDLFFADGYFIVSEKAANILRQFDLGGGTLPGFRRCLPE